MQGIFNVNWDETLDPGVDEKTSNLYHKGEQEQLKKEEVESKKTKRQHRGSTKSKHAESVDQEKENRGSADQKNENRESADQKKEKRGSTHQKQKSRGSDSDEDTTESEETHSDAPSQKSLDYSKLNGRQIIETPEPQPPDLRFTTYLFDKEITVYIISGRMQLRHGKFGHYIKPYTISTRKTCTPFPRPDEFQRASFNLTFPGSPGYQWPPLTVIQDLVQADDKNTHWERLQNWSNNNLKTYINFESNLEKYEEHYNMNDFLFCFDNHDVSDQWKPNLNTDEELPDYSKLPDQLFSQEGVHYVKVPDPSRQKCPYYEIGHDTISRALQRAEELDFEFAKRMQGLTGSSLDYTWACMDPDYTPSDRQIMLSEFTKTYVGDFLNTAKGDLDSRAVVTEELQEHRAFSQEWVRKHYKTLTPAITSAAEALVMEFYPQISKRMPSSNKMTPAQVARYFMRSEIFSPAFAQALQYYMQHLENGRGGRNPSYKQFTYATNMRALQYKIFVDFLEKQRAYMHNVYEQGAKMESHFQHELFIDWHGIVGKLPEVHRHYPRSSDAFVGGGSKKWGSGKPPWQYSR